LNPANATSATKTAVNKPAEEEDDEQKVVRIFNKFFILFF